ncbi:peptidase S53 [Xenophilus sp. AP218F]|nr:peptidase S53 [Xenophilus sp. AP218F]
MFAKQHAATLAVAALFAAGAHASSSWVATRTLAQPVQESGLSIQAQDAGEVAAGQTIRVAVSLKVRNKAQLDALTDSILQGATTRYLTREQFLSRHAPTAAQAQAVVKHLQDSGFRNIQVAANRLLITADGSAATVKTAFQTSLHHYNLNGRQAFANTSGAMVPAALADIVLAVHGLQNVHQFRTHLSHVAPQAARTSASSVVGHKPTDFPALYNASSLPAAGTTTVGIIAEGDLTQTLSDLQSFAKSAGYAAVATSVINSGTPTSDTSGTEEWNLDSQDILAAAGGAVKKMNFYVAPSMTNADITAAFNSAVSDGSAKVVNVSLGECETAAQSDGMTASADQIFQSAVAQGQIFSVSTGDSGSYECGGSTARQSYPAVSPYVIAVGGTTLSTSGATTYSSESAWNGGGGGPSYTEKAPTWQTSAGVLTISKTQRGVPDVSFDADPNSGALVLVSGSQQQIGGTSLAAPLFTGFWARIESANGNAIGFPAASIYKYLKSNAILYRDVVSGSNGAYKSAKGWDYTTGWGSLNIANLNAFIKQTPGF